MKLNEQYLNANRDHWNELAPIHARSAFYDVEGFKRGKLTLTPLEREELGDVAGKSLLHLQCHFGLDTLSWAKLGANVTGVDFSDEAIDLASSLSWELGIEAKFVLANIYDLPEVLEEKYDIVFTSYGVLCWLPDLRRWAQVASHFVRPGGTFYIVEHHPFASVFYDGVDATELKVHYPYFRADEPMKFEPDGSGSYADASAPITTTTYEWSFTLGDVVNSVLETGLKVEFLHEFPHCDYQMLPSLVRGEDSRWRLPDQGDSVPLLFSLKATRATSPLTIAGSLP